MRRSEPMNDGGAAPVAEEVTEALSLIERGLDRLAAVDVTTLPDPSVTDAVRRLGRVDGRIEGVQARLLRAAEAAGLPERSGASSGAWWLAETTRRSHRQASRTDRLAKAADTNPRIADEVARGEVGPDQAATIASGLDRGTIDPADAEDLLDNATHLPPNAFDRETRRKAGRRHQERLRKSEKALQDARFLDIRVRDDGAIAINGLLAPVPGAAVKHLIESFVTPDGAEMPEEHRRTPRQLRADALVAASEAALAAGAAGDVGGVRPHVSVVVPIEAMAALDAAEAAGAIATTETGTVLSSAAFKALACDATFRRVVVDADGMPLDVGRATRTWSPAIRAAIAAADGGCRGPCCDDLPPSRCIVHHVRFWEAGGETSVDNGVMLCNRGHDLVHVEGWTLAMDASTRVCTWTSPEGHVTRTTPYGPSTQVATNDPPRAGVGVGVGAAADADDAKDACAPAARARAAATLPTASADTTELQFDLGP